MNKRVPIAGAALIVVIGAVGYFGYLALFPRSDSSKEQKKAGGVSRGATSTATKQPTDGSQPEQVELATKEYSNQRYGFRVIYPKGWVVRENQGGSGLLIKSPTLPGYDMKAAVFKTNANSISDSVSEQLEAERNIHPDVSIVDQVASIIDNHPAIECTWIYTSLPGEKIQGTVRVKAMFTRKSDILYGLFLKVRDSETPNYDEDFKTLCEGLRLN